MQHQTIVCLFVCVMVWHWTGIQEVVVSDLLLLSEVQITVQSVGRCSFLPSWRSLLALLHHCWKSLQSLPLILKPLPLIHQLLLLVIQSLPLILLSISLVLQSLPLVCSCCHSSSTHCHLSSSHCHSTCSHCHLSSGLLSCH